MTGAPLDRIGARFAEALDDEETGALPEEQGRFQDAIEAADGWEIDRRLEIAADVLRLPPWDAPWSTSTRITRRIGDGGSAPSRPAVHVSSASMPEPAGIRAAVAAPSRGWPRPAPRPSGPGS